MRLGSYMRSYRHILPEYEVIPGQILRSLPTLARARGARAHKGKGSPRASVGASYRSIRYPQNIGRPQLLTHRNTGHRTTHGAVRSKEVWMTANMRSYMRSYMSHIRENLIS